MRFDFKISIWERVEIPDKYKEHEDIILEKIKSGEIRTSNDIIDYMESVGFGEAWDYSLLEDTIETMSESHNDGEPVIEVLNGDGNNLLKP